MSKLYTYAVRRDINGLLTQFDVEVKYDPSGDANFKYTNCVINTWKFSVNQSDVVTCDFDIVGEAREPGNLLIPTESEVYQTRVVTWNDARVNLSGPRLSRDIGGEYIRTFECNINNDVERFFSLNTVLAAQAVAPRKRDITGVITFIGRIPSIADAAYRNEDHCTESATIVFGYAPRTSGDGCDAPIFSKTLPNVVYEIETLSLTNDIFESTVNWHSLPAAGTGITDPLDV